MGVILTKLLTAMILQVPLWGQVVGALFLHLSRRSREDPHCYWGTAFFWKVNDLKETKVKVICIDKSWRVKKIGMILLVLVSWFLFLCCYVGCIRCYVCGITIVHKYMRFRWNCFLVKQRKQAADSMGCQNNPRGHISRWPSVQDGLTESSWTLRGPI